MTQLPYSSIHHTNEKPQIGVLSLWSELLFALPSVASWNGQGLDDVVVVVVGVGVMVVVAVVVVIIMLTLKNYLFIYLFINLFLFHCAY